MDLLVTGFGQYQIIFLQIILALLLGMALGVQRTLSGKNAGMRTYALVCMASTLLVIMAQTVIASYPNKINFDPFQIAGSVMQGIGFLGAGLIIFHGTKVNGLTTAAGIWMSAVIGLAVGYEMYIVATFATVMTLIVFTLVWTFEAKIRTRYVHENNSENEEIEGESPLRRM